MWCWSITVAPSMIGGEFQDMLRCLDAQPASTTARSTLPIGGHAYGWVYPGPMGSGADSSADSGSTRPGHLPNASTFCGRCESVCPVKIPLPNLMRHWREQQVEQGKAPAVYRYGLRYWAWAAQRPAVYHAMVEAKARLLNFRLGTRRGRFRSMPLATGWTQAARYAGARRPQRPCSMGRAPAYQKMSARDDILGGIRRSLGRGAVTDEAAGRLAARVAAHRRNLIPARAASLDAAGRVELFVAMAEAVQTSVARVAGEAHVPGESRAISPPRTCRPR